MNTPLVSKSVFPLFYNLASMLIKEFLIKMIGFKEYLCFKINHRNLLNKLKLKEFRAALLSHELSNTGAPITLINVAQIITNHGGFPVVFSKRKGPLEVILKQHNVPVIIDRHFNIFKRIVKYFDIAIINTVANFEAVEIISNGTPYIWWCHESLLFDYYVQSNHKIAQIAMSVPEIYTVSNGAKSFIEKYNSNVKILTYGFVDEYEEYQQNEKNDKKIVFSMIGTIHPVKGQDIFVDSILNLSQDIRSKAIFKFIGKATDQTFYQELLNKTKFLPEVIFTGELSREATLNNISTSDVIVCSSRGDSFSIAVAEALMLGKLCIMSNKTGISDWIAEGENGLIFDVNQSSQLREMLANIIQNPQIIKKFNKNARQTYIDNFTFDIFENNLMGILKEKLTDDLPTMKLKYKS